MVEVRYFAAIADLTGRAGEELELSPESTIAELRVDLISRYGEAIAPMLKVAAYVVGDEMTRDAGARLGGRVDVLPPFAGG